LISRIRNAGNNAFGAALCELIVHTLLVRLKYKVVVHPTLAGTDARPDFEATDETGNRFYVEVTTVNPADETVASLKREAPLYNSINKAKLPAGCALGYGLVKAGSGEPDLTGLVDSVERWAQKNANGAVGAPVVERFTAGEWVVELELYAGGSGTSEGPAIGVAWGGGGVIVPHKDMRGSLDVKASKYGSLDVPYLIVVADAKGQIFGKDQAKNALTEAVFGDELTAFIGSHARRDHTWDGFWVAPSSARNQQVTAILFIPHTDIWKLREPNREPILALNPWSKLPLPEAIKALRRLEAEGTKWVERTGKSFADILGLPNPWPPTE
jgi:hypothetical protein